MDLKISEQKTTYGMDFRKYEILQNVWVMDQK